MLKLPLCFSGDRPSARCPDVPVTRREMAALVMKAYENRMKSLPGYDLSKLSDGGSVEDDSPSHVVIPVVAAGFPRHGRAGQ